MAEYASKGIAGTLGGITKTIVPMSSICHAPMPQFNSWVAPTASATAPEAKPAQ